MRATWPIPKQPSGDKAPRWQLGLKTNRLQNVILTSRGLETRVYPALRATKPFTKAIKDMKPFAMTLASLLLFALPAFALEPDRCPAQFTVNIENISPYATSVSSKTPGWTAARDALLANGRALEMEFTLNSKTMSSCDYESTSLNASGSPLEASAKLFTFSQFDPEDRVTYTDERLLVKFNLDQASFSMFPSIESYETDSIRIYSQNAPQKTRIQTRLVNPRTSKLFNFDVGLANIKAN
jgi:hypothetical protein